MNPGMAGSCVFCELVAERLPRYEIGANPDFLAILDAFPSSPGQTVVLTRKHRPSYVFELRENELTKFLGFAKKVALQLDGALGSTRCVLVAEGLEIDHAHLKLYPVIAAADGSKHWEGHRGPPRRAAPDELRQLQARIAGFLRGGARAQPRHETSQSSSKGKVQR